jgi:hypothetical protein
MSTKAKREGGCLCGRTRYRIEGPIEHVVHCHCILCRRSSGAAFVTWCTVPGERFQFTEGKPHSFRSSDFAVRQFCRHCGTLLTFQEDAKPKEIDVTVATLDDCSDLKPKHHVWTSRQLKWLKVDEELPRHGSDGS